MNKQNYLKKGVRGDVIQGKYHYKSLEEWQTGDREHYVMGLRLSILQLKLVRSTLKYDLTESRQVRLFIVTRSCPASPLMQR